MPRVAWSRRGGADFLELRPFFKNPNKAKAVAARLFGIAEQPRARPRRRRACYVRTPYVLICEQPAAPQPLREAGQRLA